MKNNKFLPALFLVLTTIFVAAFFYFDRANTLSLVIMNLGWPGTIIATLLMALLCMTPLPSEGLLLMFMKVYGVLPGILLSWAGLNISTLVIFVIARRYGQGWVKKILTAERFTLINDWIERKGTPGLFAVRLLPVPALAVNFAAGVIPSINFWPYFWTAAVSIFPYYLGTSLMFMGIANQSWYWLLIGGVSILIIGVIGYVLKKRSYA
ncbi:VTT domain-containing protein [Dehalobacter sp. TeCB1]|uniref:TVP38/TMEM64 family protein n=1 Tax=Dehalobacter sp. TeCB1 TaxID=1843715 RepID=UPI00083B4F0E|nr:VTT domain-containing protein [Dehalobacter sp. TeCB1]OCZ49832.1 hypothetical protein A7D23_00340 [Dehalobacter sp. TeCB1]